jgi:hypothetical protein
MSNVTNIANWRAGKTALADWSNDISTCSAYAQLIRAEHDAESARIRFDALRRGLGSWSDADDLRQRTETNNDEWSSYIGLLQSLAEMPARTRLEAQVKRNTIGKMWLRCEGRLNERMQAGCLRDDHLLPPSMKLSRIPRA